MSIIRAFHEDDIHELARLINFHISLLIPTWGLPREFIRSHLDTNPEQSIIDPWVKERSTICAFVGETLVAAAHLLHYGSDETVSESYQNRGDIAWFLFYPDAIVEARDLLAACQRQMTDWAVDKLGAWDTGLPLPLTTGIYDKWPHIATLFREAGYHANPELQEAIYGGNLQKIEEVRGELHYASDIRQEGERIVARIHLNPVGHCIVQPDLTHKGALPLLQDWGELCELYVEETWRRQKLGKGILRIAIDKLLEKGCKNLVFAVAIADEAAGAGDFYRTMGFELIARCEDGWEWPMPHAE